MKKTRAPILSLILLVGLLLSACSPAAQPLPDPTQALPVAAQSTPVTPSPEPTPTPQTGKVLLIPAPGVDPQPYEAVLNELIAPQGWLLESRAALQSAELTPDLRAVVMLAPLPNYAELVSAAPQVQFIIFSPVDLPPAANLSVVRQRAEMQAFMAGFISELLSPDYRAGGLLPSDGLLGAQLQEAFTNGGKYYCGVCAPGWPLGLYFPAVAALPASTDGASWQAAAVDLFDNKKADVFFLSPEAARPEVLSYLQGKMQLDRTVLLVGTQAPADGFANQWAASVGFDDLAALRQVWTEGSLEGAGKVVDAPLRVQHVNENLLSTGRMRLVDELLVEIAAGRIHPFNVAP